MLEGMILKDYEVFKRNNTKRKNINTGKLIILIKKSY